MGDTRRHAARAIIVENDKLLVFERWRQNKAGELLHYYSIPGGGIEKGETPEEAVIRELMEEMGVEISVDKLLINQTTDERYHHYFACTILSGFPKFQSSSPEATVASLVNTWTATWIDFDELNSQLFYPDYQQAVETIVTQLGLPDPMFPIDITL